MHYSAIEIFEENFPQKVQANLGRNTERSVLFYFFHCVSAMRANNARHKKKTKKHRENRTSTVFFQIERCGGQTLILFVLLSHKVNGLYMSVTNKRQNCQDNLEEMASGFNHCPVGKKPTFQMGLY